MVFLIRHARPDWDRTDLVYHLPPGPPLTETGVEEANELAEFLAAAGVGLLVASPLERCTQTAQIVGERLGLEVEVQHGLIEGQPGEARSQQAERLRPIFNFAWEQSQSGCPVALISHGGPILVLLLELGFSSAEAQRYTTIFDHQNVLPTAGAWQITRPNGDWEFHLAFIPGAGKPLI